MAAANRKQASAKLAYGGEEIGWRQYQWRQHGMAAKIINMKNQ